MTKIQIICTQPGIRRNGIQHPASAIYDASRWTEKELEAFRADRAFVVMEVSGDGVKASDDAIAAEVERLVGLKVIDLQAGFNKAVSEAVAEKVATAKIADESTIDDLGKKLAAANDTIADLQKQLEAATAKAAPKK